jgi:hypothetical protein
MKQQSRRMQPRLLDRNEIQQRRFVSRSVETVPKRTLEAVDSFLEPHASPFSWETLAALGREPAGKHLTATDS